MSDPKTPPDVETDDGAPDEVVDDESSGALPLSELKALRKKPAVPEGFGESVEDKIRTRSAGRFFGSHSLTDRRWVAVLGLCIVVLGALVYLLLRNSDTGHLKVDENAPRPELAPGARDAVPRP